MDFLEEFLCRLLFLEFFFFFFFFLLGGDKLREGDLFLFLFRSDFLFFFLVLGRGEGSSWEEGLLALR